MPFPTLELPVAALYILGLLLRLHIIMLILSVEIWHLVMRVCMNLSLKVGSQLAPLIKVNVLMLLLHLLVLIFLY